METKHTPGPWFVDGVNYSDAISIGAIDPKDGCRFLLAEVHGIDESSVHCSKSEANARLISVAPTLLKVLQDFVEYGYDREIAIEAIAKATGA